MKLFEFELKTKIKFGEGEFQNIDKYVKELGYHKVFFVIDKKVYEIDYVKETFENTDFYKIEKIIYDFGEPTYDLLEKNRIKNKKNLPNCFIGIGGGSVIDFAKGLALLSTNNKQSIKYRGFPIDINPPLPVIAVPTTAGTGSDVTYNAVFIDTKEKKKLGINTKLNFPKLAILDPTFIQTCPNSVMISSGMDAFTHAIEGFGAKQSTEISKIFSKDAIKRLMYWLQYIKSRQKDIQVCENLMIGSYTAAIGLMNSGSGPSGALSYILGANFNIPHGIAGAIFLPHIIEHNINHGFTYDNLFNSDQIYDLYDNLKINYKSLKQFNIDSSNIDILLKGTESLQPAFDQNPVPFTVNDAKKLLEKMI